MIKKLFFLLIILNSIIIIYFSNVSKLMGELYNSMGGKISSTGTEAKPLVIITMTSVPKRLIRELPIALESLLLYQTYPNFKIFLAISEGQDYEEFKKERKTCKILNDERIIMKAVPDYGAAKKYIPAILEYKDQDQILMTVDDDFFYSDTLIEDLVYQFLQLNPSSSPTAIKKAVGVLGYRNKPGLTWGAATTAPNWYTFSEFSWYYVRGFRIKSPYRTGIATGGGGVMFRANWLQNSTISDFSQAPPFAKIVDDIWLNGHFSLQGIERYVVPVQDFAYSIVTFSIVEHNLNYLNRYEANTQMMHYFADTFKKENIYFQLDGSDHPHYNSYFSIGVVEPIKERIKGLLVYWKYHI